MLNSSYTNQFKKDLKLTKKRNKKISLLKEVMVQLINEEKLDEKYKDHKLIGNYKNRRECHIESDWLLIYKITNQEIIFERTGSHSDLFE